MMSMPIIRDKTIILLDHEVNSVVVEVIQGSMKADISLNRREFGVLYDDDVHALLYKQFKSLEPSRIIINKSMQYQPSTQEIVWAHNRCYIDRLDVAMGGTFDYMTVRYVWL